MRSPGGVDSSGSRSQEGWAGRVLREPTLHFVLIAAALFGASALFGGDDGRRVEISAAELEVRVLQTRAVRGTPLTEQERDEVLRSLVEERILVREARAMGLEEDARIHDILVQKMLHVLSGDVIQPTEDALRRFYRENAELYATPDRVTATEWVLPEGREPTGIDAVDGVSVPDARSTELDRISEPELEGIFDEATARAVMEAAVGEWVGPHETPRGWHWIRVIAHHSGEAPPFEEIRESLRLDWIRQEEEALLRQRVDELVQEYEVVMVGGDGVVDEGTVDDGGG